MKKTVTTLVFTLFAVASLTCVTAFAGPPGLPPCGGEFFGGPPGPPPGPPPHGGVFLNVWDGPPDLMEKLKLTDDQQKQMRLAYVDFQDRTRKARNLLMGLSDEKKGLLISGKTDQAKLAKLDEEIAKLASEVMGEDLKMKREHLSKLTPEQVDRLADFLAKKPHPHAPKMMPK